VCLLFKHVGEPNITTPLPKEEEIMVIMNLSSYPPSSFHSLIGLTNSRSPIIEFSLKPKTLFSKSQNLKIFSSINCSFSSSHLSLNFKNKFFFGKSGAPPGKRFDFRSWAILGFDFGYFESA
jgi:hypothetical protein